MEPRAGSIRGAGPNDEAVQACNVSIEARSRWCLGGWGRGSGRNLLPIVKTTPTAPERRREGGDALDASETDPPARRSMRRYCRRMLARPHAAAPVTGAGSAATMPRKAGVAALSFSMARRGRASGHLICASCDKSTRGGQPGCTLHEESSLSFHPR
eukprot:scaffold1104_cov299-Prasinococcus_capsulatus_cf.AAC.15